MLSDNADLSGTRRILEFGPLAIDTLKDRAYINNVELALSAYEFGVLFLLAQREGFYISFEQLYESVWHTPYYPDIYDNPSDYKEPASRGEVQTEISRFIVKLNGMAQSVMKIECSADKGYALRINGRNAPYRKATV